MFKCYNSVMERYQLGIKPKRIQDLIEGYRQGLSMKAACDLAFIRENEVYRWRKELNNYIDKLDRGEETDLSVLEVPVDENDCLIYKKLNTLTISLVLSHARATYQLYCLKMLKEDDNHWQKWSWLLERTFRKDFGKDVIEETPVKQVEKIQVVYIDPNQDKDRLERLEAEVNESLGIKWKS